MAKDLELALRIRADLAQARQALTSLGRNLDGVDSSAKKAGKGLKTTGESATKLRQEVSQLPALLTRMAGLLGVAFSVKEVSAAAETYTEIKNRLALVTKGSEELANAQDAVFASAQAARQPLSATAELYQRIATNAEALKLSGEGVASVVDVINKTLAISGTSGASSAAALTQLGQAFASGTLRGEELNSVLEQAPALAKTLADGLGVTVGQLRALGEQGQLTAQNVIQALQAQADNVNAQFSKIQATSSQALTVLGNSLIRVIGELDSATGSSAAFANMIGEISQWLDSGNLTGGLIESMSIWSAVFESIGADIESLGLDLGGIGDSADDSVKFVIDAFKKIPVNIRSAIQITTIEILSLIDRVVAYAEYGAEAVKAAFSSNTLDNASRALEDNLKRINDIRQQSIADILAERDAILEGASAERERFEQSRKNREEDRKNREEKIAALRLEAKNAPITLGGGSSSKSQQARQEANDKKALADLEIQLLRAQGNEQEAVRKEFENKYGEMLTRMEEKGEKSGTEIINKIIDLKKLDAQLSTAQDTINKSLEDVSRQERSINTQLDAGLISEYEAQQKIYELHQAQADKLRSLRPDLEALQNAPGKVGESARAAIAELDIEVIRLESTMTKLQTTLRDGLETGLQDAITGLANGTKSFGEAVRSVGAAVADALVQMAAQQLTQQLLGAFLGSGGNPYVAAAQAVAGYSEGGFTGQGGKYQVAGVVHRGEGVLSQTDISALGGPSGFYALRNALRNGYADGGLVGAGAPAMPSPVFGKTSELKSASVNASLDNQQNFYLIDDPNRIADSMKSQKGVEAITVVLKRDPALFRSILQIKG